MREATARGPAIDLTEFERRLRGPQPSKAKGGDPLKELARLLEGNEAGAAADPYRDMFADEASRDAPVARSVEPAAHPAQSPYFSEEEAYHGELRGSYDDAIPASGAPQRREYYEADDHQAAYHDQNTDWALDESQAYLDYGAQEEPGYAEQDQRESGRRLPKFRPWHAVAGIAALGAVSIGWTFAHRSGGSIAPHEIATIAAPEGPAKVPPPATSEATAQPDQSATILNRTEGAAVRKVVTNEEQAVDPAVAPKALRLGAGPVDAPHLPSDGIAPAPEPRKVKTVSVRPDGTVIPNDAPPPAAVAKPPRAEPVASKASPEETEVQGGTPKIAAKPATTPRAAKPTPKPAKVAVAEPPPAAEDDAAAAVPPQAGRDAGGAFAVQFGAAGSETEARDMMAKVVGKYGSQLGGRRLGYRHAKVGDKTVYRVRVGGMSKEAAVAMCEKVKAAGGACFVAAGN